MLEIMENAYKTFGSNLEAVELLKKALALNKDSKHQYNYAVALY